MEKIGTVTLIGCGPWDKEFLTLAAVEAIKNADVILYDKLINPDIMNLFPKDASIIDIGKVRNNHKVKQGKINNTIVNIALSGKNVVRTSGGDPYIFGSGTEELVIASEHNITFRVIPSIPPTTAVPAFAGIPLTFSEMANSFFVTTGRKVKNSDELDYDYENLVKLKNTTLVFHMTIKSIWAITRGLINSGMDPSTPAAVITHGFTARQEKVVGSLKTIVSLLKHSTIKPPSIFVVGEVVRLHSVLDWHRKLPLHGVKIINALATEELSAVTSFFKESGAEVIEYSSIRHIYIEENFNKVLYKLPYYDYFAFTSPVAVRAFIDLAKAINIDFRNFSNVKFAVSSIEMAEIFYDICIYPEIIPIDPSAKILAELIIEDAEDCKKKNPQICFFRGREPDYDFFNTLTGRLVCDDIILFTPIYNHPLTKPVVTMLTKNQIDFVAFFSPAEILGFVQSVSFEGFENFENITALCIGNITAIAAKKYKFKILISDRPTVGGMIDKIIELQKN